MISGLLRMLSELELSFPPDNKLRIGLFVFAHVVLVQVAILPIR